MREYWWPSGLPMRKALQSIIAALTSMLVGCGSHGWISFQPKGANFSISMPAAPAEKEIKRALPLGQLKMVEYALTTNQITFMVDYSDYPKSMTEGRSLEDQIDPSVDRMFAASPRGRHQNFKIERQGFPGRNFTIDDPVTGYSVIGTLCLVSNRIYIVQAVMPTGLRGRPEVSRFMESFRLKTKGVRGSG